MILRGFLWFCFLFQWCSRVYPIHLNFSDSASDLNQLNSSYIQKCYSHLALLLFPTFCDTLVHGISINVTNPTIHCDNYSFTVCSHFLSPVKLCPYPSPFCKYIIHIFHFCMLQANIILCTYYYTVAFQFFLPVLF